MPYTRILFYREGLEVPAVDWLDAQDARSQARAIFGIQRLEAEGHALRRPLADYLQEGIYELRVTTQNQQHRLLYFFHGRNVVVLSHGLTKEAKVPTAEIERALERKIRFERDPGNHVAEW